MRDQMIGKIIFVITTVAVVNLYQLLVLIVAIVTGVLRTVYAIMTMVSITVNRMGGVQS